MVRDADDEDDDDDDELVDLAEDGGDLFFLFFAPDNKDKLKLIKKLKLILSKLS